MRAVRFGLEDKGSFDFHGSKVGHVRVGLLVNKQNVSRWR